MLNVPSSFIFVRRYTKSSQQILFQESIGCAFFDMCFNKKHKKTPISTPFYSNALTYKNMFIISTYNTCVCVCVCVYRIISKLQEKFVKKHKISYVIPCFIIFGLYVFLLFKQYQVCVHKI